MEQARLAPGESTTAVDPKAIGANVYRGAMWELVRIGKPVPAVLMGVLLVLLVVFALTGMPWPSIIFSAVLVFVAIWSQRNVRRWAEEHNARVAPAPKPKPAATAKRAKPARNRRRS